MEMVLFETFRWIASHREMFISALERHLLMCGVSLAIALVISVPLGVAVARSPRASFIAVNLAGTIRTIPSLAILAIALPFLGIGLKPSILALLVLAIPPILLNTCIGIRELDPGTIDAATGMGMSRWQRVTQVELPLALPAIIAGIKTATIQVIGGATLASFIGGGGLGDFITAGIALMDVSQILVGAIPIALLAIASEIVFSMVTRMLTRHRLLDN